MYMSCKGMFTCKHCTVSSNVYNIYLLQASHDPHLQVESPVGGNIFIISRNELKGQMVILNTNIQWRYKRLFLY